MKLFKKLAAAGLSVIIAGSLLAGCGSTADTAQIDGTKTVVTINEDEVPLGTLSFLAKYQQAQMYAMYTAYFGAAEIFDMVMDESSGETYGETLKGYALDSIEEMVLLRQHAEEYGVSLTAEEEEQIDKVAQAYIDENSEDVRAAIGASKENVIELLELQLIKSKMLEPMAADVDTEVSDEEAQQSGVTYVKIDKATEDDFADENSDESSLADSSVADSVDVTAQVEAANAEKLSQAEAVLAAVQASGNVAEADMSSRHTILRIPSSILRSLRQSQVLLTAHWSTMLSSLPTERLGSLSDLTPLMMRLQRKKSRKRKSQPASRRLMTHSIQSGKTLRRSQSMRQSSRHSSSAI